jgi:hypothetical protein
VAEAFGLAYAECGELDAAGRATRSDAAQGRREIHDAIRHLEQLVALQPTVERENLLALAWKRLTMASSGKAADDALHQMTTHYGRAEALALAESASNLFYPVMNAIAGEPRLAAPHGKAAIRRAPAHVSAARKSLHIAATQAPDFWSVVGLVDLQWLKAVAARALAKAQASVTAGFGDLVQRVPAPHLWQSVHDQAQFVLVAYAKLRAAPRRWRRRHCSGTWGPLRHDPAPPNRRLAPGGPALSSGQLKARLRWRHAIDRRGPERPV